MIPCIFVPPVGGGVFPGRVPCTASNGLYGVSPPMAPLAFPTRCVSVRVLYFGSCLIATSSSGLWLVAPHGSLDLPIPHTLLCQLQIHRLLKRRLDSRHDRLVAQHFWTFGRVELVLELAVGKTTGGDQPTHNPHEVSVAERDR